MRESKGKTKLTFGRPVSYSKKGLLRACTCSPPAAGGQQHGTGLQRGGGLGERGFVPLEQGCRIGVKMH